MEFKRAHRTRLIGFVLRWYAHHGRALPWRETRNPYSILISETMLQQTQVQRVLVKYPEFLRKFPSIGSLARAPLREVIMVWRGMGYNNRAVRLHILARTVIEDYAGALPDDHEALRALPGVGRYTAHALLSFAFGRSVPVVDVNVRRVLSRLLWKMKSVDSLQEEQTVWKAAEWLLPRGRAYDWNQALMDLGAMICTARAPGCGTCPVVSVCSSWRQMRVTGTPGTRKERSIKSIPNRAYRGMIVDVLRDTRRSISAGDVGKRIRQGFSKRHERWLLSLIAGLERDGLVVTRGAGPLITRRVRLA